MVTKKFLVLNLLIGGIFFGANGVNNPLNDDKCHVDIVIYSYDRPLQLFALLESMEKFILGGRGVTQVIFRTTNNDYTRAYEEVEQRFPYVFFIKQGQKPRADFKPLTLNAAFETPNQYVTFVVDDIIMKDYVDLSYCVDILKKTGAYAFFLRLGNNIKKCYTQKKLSPVPMGSYIENNIFIWKFEDGSYDWNYPNNLDMTIYRKNDIKKDMESIPQIYFTNTWYEPHWAVKADGKKRGLCFKKSKIINICINIASLELATHNQFTEKWRKVESEYSTEALLKKFNAGMKIDIKKFFRIENDAPHIESHLHYIERI